MNKRKQKGFILAATLWVLAIIAIIAGYFAQWTQQTLAEAQAIKQDVADQIDRINTQNIVVYQFLTHRLSYTGLSLSEENKNAKNTLWLDDTVYRGMNNSLFSVQSLDGLVSLGLHSPTHLYNLLGLLDVPAPKRKPLLVKLSDYTDQDDLIRLEGAEKLAYRKAKLSPPPNRPLQTSWETRNILGWGSYKNLWHHDRLPRLSTAAVYGWPNFNTAPAAALQTWVGVGPKGAQKIIQARRKKPFHDVSQVFLALNRRIAIADPLSVTYFPSRHLRLSIWSEDRRRMQEIHIQLTPYVDDSKPWLVEHTINIPTRLNAETSHDEPRILDIPVFTETAYSNDSRR